MKIIQFFWVLAVLVSCSGNSDEPSSAVTITLKSDRTAILANGEDKAVLSVVDGEGNVVTQQCTFSANGEALPAAEFTTDVVGEYKLKATCQGVESNVVTVTAVEKMEVVVTADKKSFVADGVDGIVLKLATNLGEDLTAQAVFYAGEESVGGSFFTTDMPGNYKISVEHNGLRLDETILVTAVAAATDGSFVCRVLVEDYTSVGCPNCPRMMEKLDQLVKLHPRLIVAALHTDFGSTEDPMKKMPEITDLKKLVGGNPALPYARINRTTKWDENEANLLPLLSGKASVGIVLKSEIAGGQLKLKATMMSKKVFLGARCVAMLLEDGLRHYQNGSSSDIHNRVLREITSVSGEELNMPAGRPVDQSLVLPWKSSYSAENCVLVFFVMNESGSVLNVHEVRPGEQVGY